MFPGLPYRVHSSSRNTWPCLIFSSVSSCPSPPCPASLSCVCLVPFNACRPWFSGLAQSHNKRNAMETPLSLAAFRRHLPLLCCASRVGACGRACRPRSTQRVAGGRINDNLLCTRAVRLRRSTAVLRRRGGGGSVSSRRDRCAVAAWLGRAERRWGLRCCFSVWWLCGTLLAAAAGGCGTKKRQKT